MGILDRFKTLISNNHTDAVLPPEIEDAVASEDLVALLNWTVKHLQANANAPERALLLERARRRGWAPVKLAKFEVLVAYFAKDYLAAQAGAGAFLDEYGFDPDLHVVAVVSLFWLGRFEAAYGIMRSADAHRALLAERPDYAVAGLMVLPAVDRLVEAKSCADTVRRLASGDAAAMLAAYLLYFELGDIESTTTTLAEIRGGGHAREQIDFTQAFVELAQGNYQEGFRLMEARAAIPMAQQAMNVALLARPRWQGEGLAGRKLLVSAEQGLGDTLQMARYLPGIGRLGAAGVFLECPPEAVTLLQSNFAGVHVVARRSGRLPPVDFDCWIGMMSLPHVFGTTVADVPLREGYLRVPAESTRYWQTRVAELSAPTRPRVGIAWSGQRRHRADRRRSIAFDRLSDHLRAVDAQFFALQTQVDEVLPSNVTDVSEELLTLSDTAALIAEMDLVITVDTSVVHLAGALGKETWLLLPCRYEWRWGLEGDGNAWYDSVRVFRQAIHGKWDGPLDEAFGSRLPAYLARLEKP